MYKKLCKKDEDSASQKNDVQSKGWLFAMIGIQDPLVLSVFKDHDFNQMKYLPYTLYL